MEKTQHSCILPAAQDRSRHTRERRTFKHQTDTKQGFIRTTKKAAIEVTALNMHLFALLYLAKPMARRSRMTVTRIWPG